MAGVFVVGSINQDFVLTVERRPQPGETVTDAKLSHFPGGKGSNAAVAASGPGSQSSGASARTPSGKDWSKTCAKTA